MSAPLTIGILGTADIAKAVVRAMGASGECVWGAVASRDEARARAFIEECVAEGAATFDGANRPTTFGSYDALIDSGAVDAVYIPLPNSLHAEWTKRALAAGLHVLCEKPLAVDAHEARSIAKAATQAGRVCVEGYMYRFHPQWARVRELIDQGAIGRVATLQSRFTWQNYDPAANATSAELAGGALMDVGGYCVHFSRLIAGCEPTHAAATAVMGAGVDQTLVGILQFPDRLFAHFECSIDCHELHGATITGAEGSILLDKPWIPGDEPAPIVVRREGEEAVTQHVGPADSYRLMLDDFVARCRGEIDAPDPLADAVANMTAMDALKLSAAEERLVRVDEVR
ncbi:MAG: Gfo/Idh/MocA family oxidoreductase [Deltaproteobacteria bacterium]|nr:Gfo/Idh/MocA family oxidoreductase [Deltaproteobacteria bacterium]